MCRWWLLIPMILAGIAVACVGDVPPPGQGGRGTGTPSGTPGGTPGGTPSGGMGGGLGQQVNAMMAKCSSAGCHGGAQPPNLTNTDPPGETKAYARANGARLTTKSTDNHRGVTLTQAELSTLNMWMTQQAGR